MSTPQFSLSGRKKTPSTYYTSACVSTHEIPSVLVSSYVYPLPAYAKQRGSQGIIVSIVLLHRADVKPPLLLHFVKTVDTEWKKQLLLWRAF